MVVLPGELLNSEISIWGYYYSGYLVDKFNVSKISITSVGRRNLAYEINNKKIGHFLQINFSSRPEDVKDVIRSLNLDVSVLRYLLTQKVTN